MKYPTLFLLLVVLYFETYAQKTVQLSAVKQKRALCEQLQSKFSGRSESIDSLISVGTEGLKLASATDYDDLFIFHYVIGTGYYYKQNFEQARLNFEKGYEMAVKAKLIEKSLKPLGNLIAIYHYLGMQSKADETAQKLKQIAESTDSLKIKSKSDIYYNLGIYNQQQKFYYSIALEDFLKSVELHKSVVDTTKVLKLKLDYGTKLMMVAEIYLYLKQPQKALQYLEEGKPFLHLSLIFDITAYGKYIRAYALLNDQKQALQYYNLLHEVAGKTPGRWSELVSSNTEMAYLALKAKKFDQAKWYADKANIQANLDHKEILTSGVNGLYGDYYKAIHNLPLAAKYYKLSEHGARIYNKEQYVILLKSLTEVEINSGDQVSASNYFAKYTALSDSLSDRRVSLNLAEMEARFQNESKQEKIGVLDKENKAKNIELKQERTTRTLLIGGAVLLLIALFSIYLNYRNKQKANRLLDTKNKELDLINAKLNQSNQTKTKLFSIISHDLRSPVSQLFTFLKLQQGGKTLGTEEERSMHQQKLIQSSTNLLETMEDLLLWSKSQMDQFEVDEETVDLNTLFLTVIGLMEGQAEARGIALSIGETEFNVVQSDYNLLLAILRNLVQNAINHASEHTPIQLSARLNAGNQKYLSVQNQGTVISAEKIADLLHSDGISSKSSGYGLMIVKELAGKLNANLDIQSDAQGGTEIKLVFSVN